MKALKYTVQSKRVKMLAVETQDIMTLEKEMEGLMRTAAVEMQ